jgi:hypothetical protein
MLCLETSSIQLLKTSMSTESNLSSRDTCFFQVRNPFAPNKSTIPIVAHLRSLPGSATHAALINVFIYVPNTKSERARARAFPSHSQTASPHAKLRRRGWLPNKGTRRHFSSALNHSAARALAVVLPLTHYWWWRSRLYSNYPCGRPASSSMNGQCIYIAYSASDHNANTCMMQSLQMMGPPPPPPVALLLNIPIARV